MDILRSFSERLKEQMQEHNIKPKDISTSLNIELSQIYYWLRGKNAPSLPNIRKLSNYLACSVDFLAGISDNNEKPTFVTDGSFAQRLDVLIKQKKLTPYKISIEAKVPRSGLHYWLSGKTEPLLDNLVKLANYFDVSLDHLIGRES